MPRIPTPIILQAHRQNPLLPILLQECRSLRCAQNELRWLRERALYNARQGSSGQRVTSNRRVPGWRSRLRWMCHERAKGKPLQYILGDQPFGDLEILCRRGVLIPRFVVHPVLYLKTSARCVADCTLTFFFLHRPETETYTFQTANWILDNAQHTFPQGITSLRILDLCTGTGCISLLLHALLAPHVEKLTILGIDLSAAAIKLANRNLKHNLSLGLLSDRSSTEVQFLQGDVLSRGDIGLPGVEEILSGFLLPARTEGDAYSSLSRENLGWDVLISNPPYISPVAFRNGTTARSVRIYEPKLALVPPRIGTINVPGPITADCRQEDIFYHHLLSLSSRLRTKLTVLECGDSRQAERVAMLADIFAKEQWCGDNFTVDIWKCDTYYLDNTGRHLDDGARAVVLQRQVC